MTTTAPAESLFSVTSQKIEEKRKRGRPAKENALSDADRQQNRRHKLAAAQTRIGLGLLDAARAKDWDAVERLARDLLRL